MKTRHFVWVLVFLVLGASFSTQGGLAQEKLPWTSLHRLSGLQGDASEGTLVADSFGYMHVFWIEGGSERSLIMYSRFDGETWSVPANIYAGWPGIKIPFLAADVDEDANIHLVWSESNAGPMFYSVVPMEDAFSAKNWQEPIRVKISSFKVKLYIDSAGVIHVVYVDYLSEQPGIHYTRSLNNGKVWSYPTWIDPDIHVTAIPSWLDMAVDELGGIHLVWSYDDEASGGIGRWVRYAHSLDGGDSWSEPFSIDYADQEEDELRMPNPGITTVGETVHVIWAGTSATNREHRYSTDRGETWSETARVFGNLQGQAIGDGLAADAAGRVHFVGQIRMPMAVHHFTWEDGEWSESEIAYLIKESDDDEVAGRIGAHNVRLGVRAGNQLVMTFTTGPQAPQLELYAMTRLLDDMPALPPNNMPTATPTSTPRPTLAPPTPLPTATPIVLDSDPISPETSPGTPIWIGVAPAAVLLAGVVLARVFIRRR